MTQKLDIIATIICKPGTKAEVRAAVEECIALSRAEEGCEMYRFYADTEVMGRFVFIETWTNKAALDHHVTLPHFIKMAEKLTPLIEGGFDVQMLEQVF
jgi:quinol monooxygenase YgiN